jgi:hypothetical protein
MSISRHHLLLACTNALALSCASRPELARSQLAVSDMPRSVIRSEPRSSEPRSAEPQVANPYAPVRSRDAAVYSWQSERRVACTPDPMAQAPEAERMLAPSTARGVLAAFPERTSEPASRAQPANTDLVVAALRPAFHHCFSRWLDDQADAQGSVRFALELGCAGEVEAISAENQGVDESTLACLFSAVAPAHFAPPAGGHATLRVPVVFRNAAR